MDEKELGEKLEQEYEKIRNNVKKPNVLIAGTTGAGKSSVINMIFGDDVAVVGTGKPVTQKIDVYENDKTDVRIFDSKGYEIGAEADKEFYESVIGLAKQTNNPENAIHLIWYCIPCNGARVTDYDLQAIQTFHEANIPTAVVLTKADLPSESEIKAIRDVLPNWTKESTFELSIKTEEYNHLDELITWSINILPEALKDAFIKSQKANLKEKWNKAHSIIVQHTVGAFAVGFTPIPMSDAPLLVANELTLLARILYLYDLGSLSDTLKTMGLSAALGPLLTSGGKAAVGAILKLIPGVGTMVGGMISGAVGAAVTGAFGEATSAVACTICRAKLSGDTSKVEALMDNFGNEIITLAKTWISQGKANAEDYKFEDI
ncbi:MAG: 50S ribosome-binding GTPase [Treponema sp.]|nr:50S ribosome-binding GTPase [Treponema sp.]